MKFLKIITISLLIFMGCDPSNPSFDTFSKTYFSDKEGEAFAVQTIGEAGLIVAGEANKKAFLARLDEDGDVVWMNDSLLSGINYISDCIVLATGDIIATGKTQNTGSGNRDIFIMKTDDQGNVIWTRTFDFTQNDGGLCIKAGLDTSYHVLAMTDSLLTVLKCDENGDTNYTARTLIFYGHRYLKSFAPGFDGGGFIACRNNTGAMSIIRYFRSRLIAGQLSYPQSFIMLPYGGTLNATGTFISTGEYTSNGTLYVSRFDPYANRISLETYGSAGYAGRFVHMNTDGSIFISGTSNNNAMILNIDKDKKPVYLREYGNSYLTCANKLTLLDGDVVICGVTQKSSTSSKRIYVAKLN
ncbi:hypothetical protein JNM05_01230 [bacterium]|nr:hypothetical protein [bacterium]